MKMAKDVYADDKARAVYELAAKIDEISARIPRDPEEKLVQVNLECLNNLNLAAVYLAGSVFTTGERGGPVITHIPERTLEILEVLGISL